MPVILRNVKTGEIVRPHDINVSGEMKVGSHVIPKNVLYGYIDSAGYYRCISNGNIHEWEHHSKLENFETLYNLLNES